MGGQGGLVVVADLHSCENEKKNRLKKNKLTVLIYVYNANHIMDNCVNPFIKFGSAMADI